MAPYTGVLQGVGTTMWLWHLNLAIPEDAIGFTSSSAILVLAAKVLLDSGLWGTVTNSLSITARRLAAGDAAVDAYRTWRTKIYAITVSEFKLWPPWCSVYYSVYFLYWYKSTKTDAEALCCQGLYGLHLRS